MKGATFAKLRVVRGGRVVPVVKGGAAEEPLEGAERDAHVRVNQDRPDAPEDQERSDGLRAEAEEERWQVAGERRRGRSDGNTRH